jgi:hypothetical protein
LSVLSAPYAGKQLWVVHQLDNPAQLILAAMELGCSGVLVKAGDGTDYWPQIEGIKQAMLDLGYTGMLGAWLYLYGGNIPGEVAALVQALENGQPDYLCIDLEQELVTNGGAATATSLLNAIAKSKAGYAGVAYTSFGDPRKHTDFPFKTINDHPTVFAYFPQVYYADFGLTPQQALSNLLADCKSMGLTKPVAPIGQAYAPATPADIATFGQAVKTVGLPGYSFFDLDSTTGAMLKVIKGL